MKLRSLFVFSLIICTFLSWRLIDNSGETNDSETASRLIRMRNIGHQLLLSDGDSSSRVLPIQKVAPNSFKIQFEGPLALQPEKLVEVVHASMDGINIQSSYTVNVQSCSTHEIVYGFEIYGDQEKDVVPCLGRSLPKACYQIHLVFQQTPSVMRKFGYLIASLIFSLTLAFLVLTKSQRKPDPDLKKDPAFIQLGKLRFFHEQQVLKLGQVEIILTSKENQVLYIFASKPNTTINRQQLQKEVWENEGVVVGRSLDVFISKLRKKLEQEPAVRIVNIHGKGYKLEIS